MVYRIHVEKKTELAHEASALFSELKNFLQPPAEKSLLGVCRRNIPRIVDFFDKKSNIALQQL